MATTGAYKIKHLADGTILAATTVTWSRSFGKCNRQEFSRSGEIYTRSRLKAWAKKYNVPIPKELLIQFPKESSI